jgi:hypothetical protein
MRYSLRVNHKRIESAGKHPPPRQIRDRQFQYIGRIRQAFAQRGDPMISVDGKKKEQVGNFKNNGVSWERERYEVNDHDFWLHADHPKCEVILAWTLTSAALPVPTCPALA